jgi:hypothetical protein
MSEAIAFQLNVVIDRQKMSVAIGKGLHRQVRLMNRNFIADSITIGLAILHDRAAGEPVGKGEDVAADHRMFDGQA